MGCSLGRPAPVRAPSRVVDAHVGWTLALALAALGAIGCDDGPPPPPPPGVDAGPRMDSGPGDAGAPGDSGPDAGPRRDAGPGVGMDAGRDAGLTVGEEAGIVFRDAAPIDASERDAEMPDASMCLTDGGFDYCGCATRAPCTSDGDCAVGEACASDPGCGVRRCSPAGHPCSGSADCPGGSTCTSGVCRSDDPTCNDSRDCPPGYACETGACVDRRVACSVGAECPLGYYCETRISGGHPFCNRFSRPCATDSSCFARALCRDVDGDGATECIGRGVCTSNSMCTVAGEVCGTSSRLAASCEAYGYCRTGADCASGYSCVDLWGDGLTHCVRDGGSCARSSDCPTGAVCAPPTDADSPRCISAPLALP